MHSWIDEERKPPSFFEYYSTEFIYIIFIIVSFCFGFLIGELIKLIY